MLFGITTYVLRGSIAAPTPDHAFQDINGYSPKVSIFWLLTISLLIGSPISYPQLVTVRVFLGMAEAGFAPGVFF